MADYESKVKISVDDSQLDDAKKKIDNLNGKNIKANVQVSGGQNLNNVSKNFNNANKSASAFVSNGTNCCLAYRNRRAPWLPLWGSWLPRKGQTERAIPV